MKYPCKLCLVKPACSQKCNSYRIFIKVLTDIWLPICVGVTCILLTLSSFYFLIKYGEEQMFIFMQIVWVISALINLTLTLTRQANFGLLLSLCLAPITMPFLVLCLITAKMYKRA